jgi:hypothetical protein
MIVRKELKEAIVKVFGKSQERLSWWIFCKKRDGRGKRIFGRLLEN